MKMPRVGSVAKAWTEVRTPEPPPAPAQLVVRPAAAERDAHGEKGPRRGGPRARPARPCRVEPPGKERRDGERKRDGKADVAHVEHRRMHDHARILQQRIQVAAVRGRREDSHESIGKTAEGDGHEHKLPAGRGPRGAHPYAVAARGAGEPEPGLRDRKGERERERELADFRYHLRPAPWITRVCAAFSLMDFACLIASAAAGGM